MNKTTKKLVKGIQVASVAGLATMVLCENVQLVSGQTETEEYAASENSSQSVVEETVTQEPVVEEPVTQEPVVEEPVTQEPVVEEPVVEEPVVEEPVTEEPATEESATEEPATEESATEDSATEKPETEEPATEKPATEKPETEDPTAEKPTTEDPTAEKPVTEDPTTEKPTTDGGTETGGESTKETADSTTQQSQPSVTTPAATPTEEPEVHNVSNSYTSVDDTNADAVYQQKAYNPSESFVSRSEKITYNEAVPIEGLPKFITQEMIIGALKCQDETGYPASVTIAQIIQESGFGKYGNGGESGQGLSYLAYQYCNLFGIKGTGTAGSVNMKTGEQTISGENYTITAGFRAYHTYTECIDDRTQLLQHVYGDLTEGVTDANTFAVQIGGRWATSITYGQNLIQQMEYYDLYRLDHMTLKDFSDMIGTFTNPCPGASLTSGFGYRTFDNSFHKGIDLGTGSENIPTYAAAAGTVVQAGWSDSAGNWVVIDHGNGLVTKYMHHIEIYVTAGQQVEKGQQIGLSGTTGHSSGNHLHFQVEENGVAVDPTPYLSNENQENHENIESEETVATTDTSVSSEKNVMLDDSFANKIRVRLTKKNHL